MRADAFVIAAERVLDDPAAGEAEARMVIHACYYAALHTAGKLLGVDIAVTRGRHALIASALRRRAGLPSNTKVLLMAGWFDELQLLRVRADYRLDRHVTLDDADRAVEWLRGIILPPQPA